MRARLAPVPSLIGIGVIAFLLLGTPIGAVAQETEELPVTLNADSYQFDRQARIITARGHVVLSVRDVTVRADVLVGSRPSPLHRTVLHHFSPRAPGCVHLPSHRLR